MVTSPVTVWTSLQNAVKLPVPWPFPECDLPEPELMESAKFPKLAELLTRYHFPSCLTMACDTLVPVKLPQYPAPEQDIVYVAWSPWTLTELNRTLGKEGWAPSSSPLTSELQADRADGSASEQIFENLPDSKSATRAAATDRAPLDPAALGLAFSCFAWY